MLDAGYTTLNRETTVPAFTELKPQVRTQPSKQATVSHCSKSSAVKVLCTVPEHRGSSQPSLGTLKRLPDILT